MTRPRLEFFTHRQHARHHGDREKSCAKIGDVINGLAAGLLVSGDKFKVGCICAGGRVLAGIARSLSDLSRAGVNKTVINTSAAVKMLTSGCNARRTRADFSPQSIGEGIPAAQAHGTFVKHTTRKWFSPKELSHDIYITLGMYESSGSTRLIPQLAGCNTIKQTNPVLVY